MDKDDQPAMGIVKRPLLVTLMAVLGSSWPIGMVDAQGPMILNEYNAVGEAELLRDGGSDSFFGRAVGNGGDWFEIVVRRDRLDARGYQLHWVDEDGFGVMTLTDDPVWEDLCAGTILTFIEKPTAEGGLDTDLSFDPGRADWWIHVCARDARFVGTKSSSERGEPGAFSVSNRDWNLTIRDAGGGDVFGPAGEGSPSYGGDGISSREICRLEQDPSIEFGAGGNYNEGQNSTFGAPNRWGPNERRLQSFANLRRRRGADPSETGADATVTPRFRLELLETVDVPANTMEIVRYHPGERLLLATNPETKSLELFHVESLDPPKIEPVKLGNQAPNVQGLAMGGEATSVALHPGEPIALVAVLGRTLADPGRLKAIDLRHSTLGEFIIDQPMGIHPDSVAVSPDGRWAVIACEGQGHPETVGSIAVVDLDGLSADRRARAARPLPVTILDDLGSLLNVPDGAVEPEYVAIDPQSRFAAVTCQENDAVVFVDLRETTPTLAGRVLLGEGAQPDGVSLIDGVMGPSGRPGCLMAVANEGDADRTIGGIGHGLALYWIDPAHIDLDHLDENAKLMSRTDLRPFISPQELDRRLDPETVVLVRFQGAVLVLVSIERADMLVCMDATDPSRPRWVDQVRVGSHPEGVAVFLREEDAIIITGDEGRDGPGTISFARLSGVKGPGEDQ